MDKLEKIIKNVLIFMVIFLIVNYLFQGCIKKDQLPVGQNEVGVTTSKSEYSRTSTVIAEIVNNTDKKLIIANECPGEPGKVLEFKNNEWVEKAVNPELDCAGTKDIVVEPGKKGRITYEKWNHQLFWEMGRFKIEFAAKIGDEDKTFTTNEFIVIEEGIFSKLWNGILYRPIYNVLMFLVVMLPGNDLGLAIIILTLIIRAILLVPSQKAMRSQKKLQEVNPRIEKLKEKYKGDQQKIAAETMAIWKESKVNPLSSCMPILLQLPILIAVYQTVRNGLNPDNTYMLYTTYSNFSLKDINVNFFGILDLTKVNVYVLPLIIGGLQFAQMKLTMAKTKKKTASNAPKNEMAMANNMMVYMMPVMIALFTASVPAGVALYWGISTIFGIGQQLVVNKEKPKEDEVKVRVIEN